MQDMKKRLIWTYFPGGTCVVPSRCVVCFMREGYRTIVTIHPTTVVRCWPLPLPALVMGLCMSAGPSRLWRPGPQRLRAIVRISSEYNDLTLGPWRLRVGGQARARHCDRLPATDDGSRGSRSVSFHGQQCVLSVQEESLTC